MIANQAYTATTANIALIANAVTWENVSGKPSMVTSNYHGTFTATAFVGDGSGLTGIAATTVANDSVTSAKIVDGTIVSTDISNSAAIPFSKLLITKADIVNLGIPTADTDTDTNTTYTAGTGLSLSSTTFSIAGSVVTSNYNSGISISATVTANAFVGDGSGLTSLNLSNTTGTLATSKGGTGKTSFGSGSIAFGDGTGLTENNSSLHWNNVSGRLGIGTNSEIVPLTVVGSNTVAGFYASSTSVPAAIAIGQYNPDTEAYTSTGELGIASGDGEYSANATNGDFIIRNYNSDRKVLIQSGGDDAILTVTNTNVGIANASPSALYTLDMVGSANITGTVIASRFSGNGSDLTNVTATSISNDAVTSAKILNATIVNADISASAAISNTKLDTAVVTSNYHGGATLSGSLSLNSTLTQTASSSGYLQDIRQQYASSGSKIMRLMFDGIDVPNTSEHFIDFVSSENSGVLVRGSIYGTGGATNITVGQLQNSSSEAIAFASRPGIVLTSSGADYAEYIRKENPTDVIAACDIVGVKNGRVSKTTMGADRIMVVSQKPIVVGNTPDNDDLSKYALISFVGQVYVNVDQPVRSGQYIVASGKNDGMGVPKNRDDLTAIDIPQVVGQAWETSDTTGRHVIKVAITPLDIPGNLSAKIEAIELENKILRTEIEAIKSAIGGLKK
jgi:hypothetical protein